MTPGFTLKINDTGYYADATCATMTASQTGITFTVLIGHGIEVGDTVYFAATGNIEIQRQVVAITDTSFTIFGPDVQNNISLPFVLVYKTSLVLGDVAIVNGNQTLTNVINVLSGYTLQVNDVVQFTDSSGNMQQRTITAIGVGIITVSGIPVSVNDHILIACITLRSDAITLRRTNALGITFTSVYTLTISNNLRINIYRTLQGEDFTLGNVNMYLVTSLPNNSFTATQLYVDGIPDSERGAVFANPVNAPNPPPISKYVRAFGNQMFYGGGKLNVAADSDLVFFSIGNNPEIVPLASNSFSVPNVDDEVTGLGVSGSTFVTTKNHSLWAATGNFLTGQIEVVQISPGSNIGCVANATIASIGTLLYFLHTNGLYAITENQLFPTDNFGNPVPISLPIDRVFRETRFLPQTRYVLKRAVGTNYTKDNQYLLFLPCEDVQSSIRTANTNSIVLSYDYQDKNWFQWININAAGGFLVIDDDLYFQERRFSSVVGNTANLYKQHRFYRLIDHADHAGPQNISWTSSWEDLKQPWTRKKFCRCILLMDRLSDLLQYNQPIMTFSTYLNRLPNLQSTIAQVTQVDNIRNSSWSYSPWGWGYWSGYQDSFITINLKQGTVAKSMQVGFTMQGINMDMRFAGYQLEIIPENRNTVLR